MSTQISDARYHEVDTHWVGDQDNGLAHMVVGELLHNDIAECGVELHGVSVREGRGRLRCGLCREAEEHFK